MNIKSKLQYKINSKTKPLGSLGILENIALQLGLIQNTITPELNNPTILIFSGDHGIASQREVSAFPQEVTYQMVLNFLNQGAAINIFCKQNNIDIKIIDSGVNYDFKPSAELINAKIKKGTNCFLNMQAISSEELELCFSKSETILQSIFQKGCNIIGFGEMGIGNTSSASMIMSYICNLPLEKCVGKGAGLSKKQISKKLNILQQAKDFHGKISDPKVILQNFGGYEIAQMCGAMLKAYKNNMIIMVDGFIASTAFLVAQSIQPKIQDNAFFCHLSDERGHKLILEYLKAHPILNLNLRLGEGTGCALAYPIIKSAERFLNEMTSFESAQVSNKIKNQ